MRSGTNRFTPLEKVARAAGRLGLAAVVAAAAQPARAQIRSTVYSRTGTLPAVITTRAALEQLTREAYRLASATAPGDSVVRFGVQIQVHATDTHGHAVSVDRDSISALDSLARLMDRRSELWVFQATIYDMRWFHADSGFVTAPYLRDMSISCMSDAASPTRNGGAIYSVWGRDRARVDAIADRIDAFGKTWATWRSPKNGEVIRTSLKLFGLILIPLALGLRDRRFSWVLYPTGLLVFASSYLVPFATLFGDCRIMGS